MITQPTHTELPQRQLIDVAAILTRAAVIAERNGFNQGSFVATRIAADGTVLPTSPEQARYLPVCAVGAIRVATSGQPDLDCPAARAAVRWLSSRLPGEPPTDPETGQDDHVEHVAGWNDAAERTAAEVVSRLRTAALVASGVAVAA